MSSLTHSVRAKMAGFLQGLVRKLGDTPAESAPAREPQPVPRTETAPTHTAKTAAQPRASGPQNGKGLALPLQPILAGLPLELQPRIKLGDAGGMTISVPLEKILPQLAKGAVKISFGELRQAAPHHFTAEADRDHVLLALPLGEILSRLNPTLIKRRSEQKLVEVPAEISSPFDRYGQGLAFSVSSAQPEAAPARSQTPRQSAPPTPPASVAPPPRHSIAFAPTPTPPTTPPLAAPKMTPPLRAPRDLGISPLPSGRPPPAAARIPMAAPARAKAINEADPLLVSLPSLAESWPEAVRKEMVQLNLVEAKVALPIDEVERALKQGRVAFTWKMLRSWLTPSPLTAVSAHDATVLELPLKNVAPLYLARQQETNAVKRKVTVDEDIPNLFFGFPQAEPRNGKGPTKTAGAKSSDTNYYVWDDTVDRPQERDADRRPAPSPGTKFISKYATPNEVVSRAAGLEGVAGALIALPDGLMVASQVSGDLNGDTLAAFLPQIFGKVNACTKELRMGELNNLNFTVGNVPWKIFRVNAIFFAAFGRLGEPLPTAQLAALAAELDHKPK